MCHGEGVSSWQFPGPWRLAWARSGADDADVVPNRSATGTAATRPRWPAVSETRHLAVVASVPAMAVRVSVWVRRTPSGVAAASGSRFKHTSAVGLRPALVPVALTTQQAILSAAVIAPGWWHPGVTEGRFISPVTRRSSILSSVTSRSYGFRVKEGRKSELGEDLFVGKGRTNRY